MNRRLKLIQGRDGKTLDDALETLRIYSHVDIELTWVDGIHALYAFTSKKRFDLVISSYNIIHLAGFLESFAVARTKYIFEMYEQLISTSQKQFLLYVLLKYCMCYWWILMNVLSISIKKTVEKLLIKSWKLIKIVKHQLLQEYWRAQVVTSVDEKV